MHTSESGARFRLLASLLAGIAFLAACSGGHDDTPGVETPSDGEGNVITISAGPGFENALKEALFNAVPGDTVVLPAGEFALSSGVNLDIDGVTVRGQGQDKTLLNFANQAAGGESVLVTSNNVVLEDFAVIDPPADGVKFKFSNGVTMRGLRVEWTCGACEENGAYGIYPVQTENVLVEDSIVIGASDAGVYVGQSDKIIVRRNEVSLNVAGIEIENSTNSEVYENLAFDNTGGILVFDLPNLSREGERSRVYNNTVRGNNTANFAPEGNIVGVVPAGTGMLIMAFEDVEVFDNVIEDHASSAIVVVSYEISGFQTDDANYDPSPKRINIHDNQYRNNAYDPQDMAAAFEGLFGGLGGMPQIVYDGIGEQDGPFDDAERICIREDESVLRGTIFGPGGDASIDHSFFDCAHPSLPEVVLDSPEDIEQGERPPTAEEIAQLCTPQGNTANFAAADVNCPTLSGYNLFASAQEPRSASNGGVHYEMITPLFTDYAEKYRFVFVPEGKQAAYSEQEALDFPIGTVITKTFTMPYDLRDPSAGEKIIETRLLIRRVDGWVALPYIWREDGTDADLAVAGATQRISWTHSDGSQRSTDYVIPDANSCKTCHGKAQPETGSGVNMETVLAPIGLKARFINRDNQYQGQTHNQLAYLVQQGILVGAPADLAGIDTVPAWDDGGAPLEDRAKAYLDINCAHCHSPEGFASNSALYLEYWRDVDTNYGVCKTPVAAGSGSGGLQYSIVPGDDSQSIMTYRMDSNEADVRMPEIGRSMVHTEGVALVREWINSLSGGCPD